MKNLYTIVLSLLFISTLPSACLALHNVSAFWTNTRSVDDEYDRYKKKADDLFKEGRYSEAIKQFANCLEVPGFEKDVYATTKIEQSNRCIDLRQRAEAALNAQKGAEAVALLQQILVINVNDPITKSQLTDYWSDEGNTFYSQQKYAEAKSAYSEALKYTSKKDILTIQIRNSEQFLKQQQAAQVPKENPKPAVTQDQSQWANTTTKPQKQVPVPKIKNDVATDNTSPKRTETKPTISTNQFTPRRTGLKVAVATIGVGAGIYAFMLNSQYKSKINALNEVSKATDSDSDDLIMSQADFTKWQTAYSEAETARSKNGLFKACVGVAAVAAAAEVYLLIRKPKVVAKGLSWKPASQGWGLAVQYTF